VSNAAAEFVRRSVSGRHFAEMERVVARLQGRGSAVWAVSSTNRWVVEAGVAAFGIAAERVLAAKGIRTCGGPRTGSQLHGARSDRPPVGSSPGQPG
jgi:phosphoserine phosphatase